MLRGSNDVAYAIISVWFAQYPNRGILWVCCNVPYSRPLCQYQIVEGQARNTVMFISSVWTMHDLPD